MRALAGLGLIALAPRLAAQAPVDPDLAKAAATCQARLADKPVEGQLKPPALVLRLGPGESIWSNGGRLAASHGSGPQSLFCVVERYEKYSTYTDGSIGYKVHQTITALSWPEGKVLRRDNYTSFPPDWVKTDSSRRDHYGDRGIDHLESWLTVAGGSAVLADFAEEVDLSPDRRAVVVRRGSDELEILEWPSRRPRGRVSGVYGVGFAPDGRFVTRNKKGKGIDLWDVTTGKKVGGLPGPGGVPTPDGSRVFVYGVGETAELWELLSGRKLATGTRPVTGFHTAMMSADGARFCVARDDRFSIWDFAQDRAVKTFDLEGWKAYWDSLRCAVSSDGNWAVANKYRGSSTGLYRLSVADGSTQRLDHSGENDCLALSPDGRWLALGKSGQLSVWDFHAGKEIAKHQGPLQQGCSLNFSLDGALLIQQGSGATRTRLWDVARLTAGAPTKP